MKYCQIFMRSGETMYSGEMNDTEAERLKICFREQAPGVLEFEDDEGVFLLQMADVVCICCNNEPVQRTAGFTKTDTH